MRKFKRFSIFLLVGILLFSLFFTACGTNTGNQSGSSDPASESSSTPDESLDSSDSSLDPSHDEQYEGTLYTLERAYKEGKITREQLLNIAYHQGSAEYNQEEINENFTPIPKGDLTEDVSLEIRTALAEMHREYTGYENITAKDFSISSNYYYGCYNNYHVFFFENVSGIDSYPTWDYEYNEEIDGVTFHFNFPIVQTIYVYG